MSNAKPTIQVERKTTGKPKKVAAGAVRKVEQKVNSTPVNGFYWLVTIGLVAGISVFNQYNILANPIAKLVSVVVAIALALGAFVLTNQGRALLRFASESMLELRKIYWPTRKEALQTSIIVVIISVLTSFMFWLFDGVIQTVVNLITQWNIFN